MANYDSNKEAHQLTVVDGTITPTSLIPCQDAVSNPLGVATPPAIVGQTTLDDIQDGTISKKISAATKTGYDNHLLNTSNPHTVTKAQVGLANVDNTSDVNKPVSTAQALAIAAHTNLTNNPHAVTKTQVGLSVVDNTADADKPISIAGLAANAAINANIDVIEQDVLNIETILNTSSLVSTSVTSVLMAINVNKTFVIATDLQYIPGTAVIVISNTDRTKWMHGYVISYTAGTKTLVIKPTKMNGTGTYASWSIAQSSQLYETITSLLAVHTVRVDNPHNVTKAQVGLSAVDNTSDVNKPVSTATQTALNLKVSRTSSTGSALIPAGTTAQRDASPVAGHFRFNGDEGGFEGYDGTEWGEIGGGGLQWIHTSTSMTAEFNRGYLVDTSAGSVTITLPASPDPGDQVGIAEIGSAHNTIIARNGSLIQGIADNLTLDSDNQSLLLVFAGASVGWRLVWTSPTGNVDSVPTYAVTAARKNLIINGGFDIWQRAMSQTVLGYGSADRWRMAGQAFVTAAKINPDIADQSTSGSSVLRLTGNSTGDLQCYMYQAIEDARLFRNKTITVSFMARSTTSAGTIQAQIVAFSDPLTTIQNNISSIRSWAINATWSLFSFSFTFDSMTALSASSTTSFIRLNIGMINTSGTGQSVEISKVQVEFGDTATEFEYRHISEELAMCQRYYEEGGEYRSGMLPTGSAGVSTTSFKTYKRATTIVTKSLSALVNVTDVSIQEVSANGFSHYPTVTNPSIVSRYQIYWTADAEI